MSSLERLTIDITRFVSIFLVLCIHAANSDLIHEGSATVVFFSEYFSVGAVPVFFCLAGFLLTCKERSLGYVLGRMKGLLIIYFFWNGLLWIFSLVAYYFLGAFNAPGFIHDKIFGGLLSVFGLSEHYPINYQFWFLKDLLFCFFVFSVIMVLGLHRKLFFAICVVASVAVGVLLAMYFSSSLIYESKVAMACAFFFLGCLIGGARCYVIGFDLSFAIFACSSISLVLLFVTKGNEWNQLLFVPVASFVLILSIGLLISHLCHFYAVHVKQSSNAPDVFSSIRFLSAASFFIYCAHEPAMTLFVKLFSRITGNVTVLYLSAVLFIFFFLLGFYHLCPKSVRRKYWFIFAGRYVKE